MTVVVTDDCAQQTMTISGSNFQYDFNTAITDQEIAVFELSEQASCPDNSITYTLTPKDSSGNIIPAADWAPISSKMNLSVGAPNGDNQFSA